MRILREKKKSQDVSKYLARETGKMEMPFTEMGNLWEDPHGGHDQQFTFGHVSLRF